MSPFFIDKVGDGVFFGVGVGNQNRGTSGLTGRQYKGLVYYKCVRHGP